MTRLARALAMLSIGALCACRNPVPPPPPLPTASPQAAYGDVPAPTASAPGAGGATQRFLAGMDVPGQWWTLFHSSELNTLIDEALKQNPDIKAAQAALRSARETYYAQRASAYPSAQASFGVSREQFPTYLSPPLNTSNYAYGVHTLSLDVGYTPDVFGNLRYQTVSAAQAAEAQRFEVEATYLTLTSNVVVTAVEIASLRDQIATTQRLIAIDRHLLDLTKAQRTYGQVSGLDVATADSSLRQIEATLPPLQKQLGQTRDQLARLLGLSPSQTPQTQFTLASLHLPETLPLSVPSKLVEQRPDIAAATQNLAQAGSQVGVAYTNRLPNFSISAQTATQALSLGGLFGAGSLLSMLTGQVATTVYDQGTLKHRQEAAVAAYDEAAAQYQGAVLSGYQNVADSMIALERDADALVSAVQADRAAGKALEIVRYQKEDAQVSQLSVLNAEQAYRQAELNVVQAEANRFMDTAALFQALGGGWWNRTETVHEK